MHYDLDGTIWKIGVETWVTLVWDRPRPLTIGRGWWRVLWDRAAVYETLDISAAWAGLHSMLHDSRVWSVAQNMVAISMSRMTLDFKEAREGLSMTCSVMHPTVDDQNSQRGPVLPPN